MKRTLGEWHIRSRSYLEVVNMLIMKKKIEIYDMQVLDEGVEIEIVFEGEEYTVMTEKSDLLVQHQN